ncbi:MAG: DUF885 domain-containing protein [Myxococcales bacterium]|nr:DUF885 domain-containing protein [Myxococcales bacterium]
MTPDTSLEAALAEAEAGVDDPRLRELLRRHWAWHLERSPLEATRLGVHAYDDRVAEVSPEAIADDGRRRRAFLTDARAIEASALSDRDQLTLAIFKSELEASIGGEICRFENWLLSPANNPVSEWGHLAELQPITTPEEGRRYVARVRQIPGSIRAEIDLLADGFVARRVTTAESARRVKAMIDGELARPLPEWPLLAPAAAAHPDWPKDQLDAFRAELGAAVAEVRPALVEFGRFIDDVLADGVRGEGESGVVNLPDGLPCYRSQIRVYTSLSRSPKEIHAIGLAEVARINKEMQVLGKRLFGSDDLAAILRRLREDRSLYFDTPAEILGAAEAGLQAARAKIPDYFGILPKAPCEVREIPDYEAPFTHIGYYRHPIPGGVKPGEYFVNTYRPETRPRFEARVLAIHESIPGHHLQLAIAQELPATPAFRKHAEQNVFVEGWALYTEDLAEEMGLYESDLDRMGKLSFAAWRASRLVVDTGIHAFGWSRAEGERFMAEHTALALNNISNEVDRYINWPGQALGYKLGELEILRLRREAEEALGERFDIKEFHDVILGGGPMPLPMLEAQVGLYLNARAAGG